MKKMILFGDSLIANFGRSNTEAIESAVDFDVYNCATGGWDTNHCVRKATYIAQLKPEVVVLSFGTNDSTPDRRLELDSVVENVKKIIDIFAGSSVIVLLPPPIHEERQEPGRNRSNETIEKYANSIKKLLDEEGVAYIDSAIFQRMFDSGVDYHEEDGIHFNDLGYETVINEIASFLKRA